MHASTSPKPSGHFQGTASAIAGYWQRFFFNDLTEEIRKVSVGSHADTSFARTVQLTSASGEQSGWRNAYATHVSDTDRFSTVTEFYGEELAGTAYWETGTGWNITGKRTFAIWAKATADDAWVCICVKSTDNNYYGLVYQGTTGSDYNTGNGGVIRVGGTAQDFTNGEWVRLERDLQADLTARFGKTLSCVTGSYLWSGGLTTPKMWIDDLSFSNSLTVEHNTLGGGVIGHILRNRSTNASTYAATDRWFHYDQVGSVMSESDAAGALAQTHYQDAFGNSQASWSTGLWGGDKPGWHHNTKEFDGDIGLVYMHSRWYNAETGTFLSRAKMPPMTEHPYGFGGNVPTSSIDPRGDFPLIPICIIAAGIVICTSGCKTEKPPPEEAPAPQPTPEPTPEPEPEPEPDPCTYDCGVGPMTVKKAETADCEKYANDNMAIGVGSIASNFNCHLKACVKCKEANGW